MECIITIEIGTGAIRVAAFDLLGNLLGASKGAYPTFHAKPDFSEQDPEQIFITMLYMLKNFLNEKIHPKKYEVVSICFNSAMHSVLAIDKNGVPLGNAIVWSDNRAKKEAGDLKNGDLGKSLYKATGTPIHAMSPLNKIKWLKNNDKDRFAATQKFISIKTYILQQLTGEYVIDYSVASATGMLNIHSLKWEDDALKHVGIDKAQLAEVVPIFYSPKNLKKEYQSSLGLPDKVKIIVGSSDGCMATLGAGVWDDGKATVTLEESGALRVVGKEVLQDEKQRLFNYVLSEGYYVSGGPTNNVGSVFEWYAKQFGDFKKSFDLEDCIENLINDASKVAAGADGLIFLPYLQGERAPIWNANARGVYFGLNIKHEQKHFVRATIEGILYGFYSIAKTLQEHRCIKSLSANGSYASFPLWLQMIADIFNKPVLIKQSSGTDSVACGGFLVSATAMGLYQDLTQAAQKVQLREDFHPSQQNHDVYMKHFTIFERLGTKLFDEFEAISEICKTIAKTESLSITAMNKNFVNKLLFAAAGVLLLAWILVTINQLYNWGGWLLMAFFLCLTIAFQGHKFLKSFSYTALIFAAVSLSLYYPNYFKTVGTFNLTAIIVPLLQLIMFGMGTELSLQDFRRIVQMPKGVIIGVICHYTIMPFIGFGVANLFNFPPEIAAGIILVGCSPSGLASNVMCYLSRGNLALSVSVTTVSTLLAPLLTPLLMQLLGGSFITIHFLDMVWEMVKMVVLPVAAGILVHYILKGRANWLNKILPVTSMVGIVLILVVIIAKGRDTLLQVGGLIILATFIHNTFGYLLGYWSGRLLKFNERDCRTIALEVGMQNAGLASALASKISTNPAVALAPAIFGPMMNITGSLLSSWWHNRNPTDDVPARETAVDTNQILKVDVL